MSGTTALRPLGDAALLVELGDLSAAHRLLRRAAASVGHGAWRGVEELVVGMGTVTVVFDPARCDQQALAEQLATVAAGALAPGPEDEGAVVDPAGEEPVELVVRFDGPDLDDVARASGLSPADVVAQLTGEPLEVAFVGFSPGFAYLHGLPSSLRAVPRRERPRPSVPAGAVAVGGGFAAVYPQATPGGWHLVGRCAAMLFDPDRAPHALLAPGRRVRFVRSDDDVGAPPTMVRPTLRGAAGHGLLVEGGGTQTVVEDLGRIGVAGLGVPRAGAADPVAARLANRLVGNVDGAAVLEMLATGPALRATADLHVVVVGDPARPGRVEPRVDGRAVPEGTVVPVAAGQLLEIPRCGDALRAVLAVAGAFDTPMVLGSRSADLLCGLGPAPLAAGDVLAVGPPGRPRGRLVPGPDLGAPPWALRVLPGPDVDGPGAAAQVLAGEWRVRPESNRVGLRLDRADGDSDGDTDGIARDRSATGVAGSRGVVTGVVQLPPGGEAVVLGPDHATVGGYPIPAVVVTADLHRLAHLRPGDVVRFEVVDPQRAASARAESTRRIDGAVEGWFPTRAD